MDKSIGDGTAAVLVYDDSLREFHTSDLKKYLEQEGFEKWYPAHNYDMPWIYVNLNSKVYARGMPGIGMVSPFGKHAVTIEEFKGIYNIYKNYEGLNPLQMTAKVDEISHEITTEEEGNLDATEIEYAKAVLQAIKNNEVMRSIIYISSCEEKNMVLINYIKEIANKKSIEYQYIEINSLSEPLADVIISLGKTGKASKTSSVIFVDSIQKLNRKQISAFVETLHRANQLNYPITIISSGNSQIRRLLGNAKPYSERLFEYREI